MLTAHEKWILRALENFIEKNCHTEDDERKFEWFCDMLDMFRNQDDAL